MTDKKDNKPKLKLVSDNDSRKDKDKKSNVIGGELTAKQMGFCRDIVFNDMTYIDAYRNNYNVSDKTKGNSLRAMASKLRADVNITLTINKLLEQKQQLQRMNEVKRSDIILQKIEKMADDINVTDAVRLKGLELLGKHHGLFTDVLKVDDKRDRSSSEIENELLTRLNNIISK
jgi:hypothetical protein